MKDFAHPLKYSHIEVAIHTNTASTDNRKSKEMRILYTTAFIIDPIYILLNATFNS
jgi:hypothetical protein